MSELQLTKEEQAAILALKRLSRKWPRTLWLFSASGTLCVMKKDDDGERVETKDGGVDPDYCVDAIRIENDGGDW